MKLLMENWRRLIEAEESSPELEAVLSQLEGFSLEELRALWQAVANTWKQKQAELKAGFKKGDRVAFDSQKHGELTGTVVRRGGKYVMVSVEGWKKPWKRTPSSLRKME